MRTISRWTTSLALLTLALAILLAALAAPTRSVLAQGSGDTADAAAFVGKWFETDGSRFLVIEKKGRTLDIYAHARSSQLLV